MIYVDSYNISCWINGNRPTHTILLECVRIAFTSKKNLFFLDLTTNVFLTQEELRKFIKFACNQERIPFGHTSRGGGEDRVVHVPPYPMKIAPPDGQGMTTTYSTMVSYKISIHIDSISSVKIV